MFADTECMRHVCMRACEHVHAHRRSSTSPPEWPPGAAGGEPIPQLAVPVLLGCERSLEQFDRRPKRRHIGGLGFGDGGAGPLFAEIAAGGFKCSFKALTFSFELLL
jgi:hypothetical protein